MVPKLITLEEHFISSKSTGSIYRYHGWTALPKLQNLGDERIKDMDAGSVEVQVISHAPALADAEECRQGNDELAKAYREKPRRFPVFAILPMWEPEAAAAELERAVKDLGFVGALINNHTDGTFYDGEKYWTVF